MATVVMEYPRPTTDAAVGGTYGTNADGSLVPRPWSGWVDVPGNVVSFFEDSTGALLGTTVASSIPVASGPMAGWYAWSFTALSWSSAPGLFLPTMAAAGAMNAPTFAAILPLPSMAGVGGMAEPTYSSGATFSLPSMAGKGGMVPVSITAVVGLPAMAGSGTMVAPTIEAGSGGGATGVYGQASFPAVYSSGDLRVRSNGTNAVGYVVAATGDDGDEGGNFYDVLRSGATLAPGQPWSGAAYIRLEADDTGGGLRVRSAASAAGPWTTVWSYTDPSPLTGGSASHSGLENFTPGTY
jgi:hypothetical protein